MANYFESNPLEVYLGRKYIQKDWISFLIFGIVLIVLGFLAIIGAQIATLASIVFFGIVLTIGGVLQIIYAFLGRKGQGFAHTLLSGLFYTAVGLAFLTHPAASALAVTLLLAAFYTVSGLYKIVISLTTHVVQWGWLLISGIISLLLGIFIWAEWPAIGLWLIGLFIGIDLIFIGWFWLMLSMVIKDLPIDHKYE